MINALSINTFVKLILPAGILDCVQIFTAFLPTWGSVVIPLVQVRAIHQSRLSNLYYAGLNFCSVGSCKAFSLVPIHLKSSQKEQ